MFTANSIMFIYAESPLHAGTGRSLGAVDLPIQRERTTQYPMIQGSGIKGQLRAITEKRLDKEEHLSIFGPETSSASDHAGALSVGDARILLFPVRSLNGVFAWTTSLDVLARFARDAALAGIKMDVDISKMDVPAQTALIGSTQIRANDMVVLEEFSFAASVSDQVEKIGLWLAENALPKTPEYDYWRKALPSKLCILPEDVFRDFALYATEVQTHVKIDPDKKVVIEGMLWTAETLPVDTLMYAPINSADSYRKKVTLTGAQILDKLKAAQIQRIHLGGDATTGQGMVALQIK